MSLSVSASVTALWLALMGMSLVLGAELPVRLDPIAQTAVSQYLNDVSHYSSEARYLHGVWIQSGQTVLAEHQGMVPMSVASLTKIATTLAALHAWGPTHQFTTLISATGPIRNGVLQGDLIVQGGGDPFFVIEDATELRQALQQLGLKRITGKLVIIGDFYMNFTLNPARAGQLFKHALQGGVPTVVVRRTKRGKRRPVQLRAASGLHMAIAGPVQVVEAPLARQTPLVRYRSLPLVHILKRMNVYSNNAMAEMLAAALGGPQRMVRQVALAAGLPAEEFQLINGSGLGPENRLAPRTVCALLVAIHRALRPAQLTLADVFPVAGIDHGTIRRRHLPFATVVKTGTLRHVSTLAGVMLTRAYGPVWFALINQGSNVEGFREQQDTLLQSLMQAWGAVESRPPDFAPMGLWTNNARTDILLRVKGEGG